jgi:hypothetical protein
MNDAQFGRELAARLTEGLARVDESVVTRLQLARKAALGHVGQRATSQVLVAATAGGSDGGWRGWLAGPRLWLAASALLIALVGVSWSEWASYRDASDAADLDLAILADDLPVIAYIDNGFDAWLKRPVDPAQ